MPDNETCKTRFELSQDGKNFTPCIGGNSKRINLQKHFPKQATQVNYSIQSRAVHHTFTLSSRENSHACLTNVRLNKIIYYNFVTIGQDAD